jgi:hypothetical protein
LKWFGWIAQRPNHYINNFTGKFAMSLRLEVSTITRRDFLLLARWPPILECHALR